MSRFVPLGIGRSETDLKLLHIRCRCFFDVIKAGSTHSDALIVRYVFLEFLLFLGCANQVSSVCS